jgi:hypothetical protein
MTSSTSFDEQVQASFKDLQKYSDKELRILAKRMKIKTLLVGFLEKSRKAVRDELCYKIAQKIIYINSKKPPLVEKNKCSRYRKKLTAEEIAEIRKTAYDTFKRFKDSVGSMTVSDLQKLFSLYDKLCFNGDVEKYIKDANFSLKFKTSGEQTFTTEGICTHRVCNYTMTIPTAYFKNVHGPTIVAGQSCKDQLDCLLRVIEHELVHLIIFMFCGDSFITDQHGELFMNMVERLFGHTDYRHYIF